MSNIFTLIISYIIEIFQFFYFLYIKIKKKFLHHLIHNLFPYYTLTNDDNYEKKISLHSISFNSASYINSLTFSSEIIKIFVSQENEYDCGLACCRMVFRWLEIEDSEKEKPEINESDTNENIEEIKNIEDNEETKEILNKNIREDSENEEEKDCSNTDNESSSDSSFSISSTFSSSPTSLNSSISYSSYRSELFNRKAPLWTIELFLFLYETIEIEKETRNKNINQVNEKENESNTNYLSLDNVNLEMNTKHIGVSSVSLGLEFYLKTIDEDKERIEKLFHQAKEKNLLIKQHSISLIELKQRLIDLTKTIAIILVNSSSTSENYTGHYILLFHYNPVRDSFLYFDPSHTKSLDLIKEISAEVLDTLRSHKGTDRDIILISK